jgi:hypothetical protein
MEQYQSIESTGEPELAFPNIHRTIRKFKPPANKPALPQLQQPHNTSNKDHRPSISGEYFPSTPNTHIPKKKTGVKLRPKPATHTYSTFKLLDDPSSTVIEYRVFKNSERFFGNMQGFNDPHPADGRDNDLQTTDRERKAGEKRSAHVLEDCLAMLERMQVHDSSCCFL